MRVTYRASCKNPDCDFLEDFHSKDVSPITCEEAEAAGRKHRDSKNHPVEIILMTVETLGEV